MSCTTCPPENQDCNCPVKDLNTDCSTYKGTLNLTHINTNPSTILTQVLININTALGNFKDSFTSYFQIGNVGLGSTIFKGTAGSGVRELKSLIGGSNVTLTDGTDDITISVPDATTEVKGTIEIATQAEVDAQADAIKAVTPATLGSTLASGGFLPEASTTVKGIIEIATQTEVDAKVDTTRAIVPSTLSTYVANPANLPKASETTEGIVERATIAEAQALTDTVRFISPATLNNVTATEIRRGLAEIATTAETTAGTDDLRIITPLKLQQKLNTDIPTNTSDIVNDGDGVNNFVTEDQIAFVNKAVALPYTVLAADRGAILHTTGTGNLTIPSGLGADFECGVIQDDTGTVTIVGSATTILYPAVLTNVIAGQYFQVYIRKAIAAETYNLLGNLTTA